MGPYLLITVLMKTKNNWWTGQQIVDNFAVVPVSLLKKSVESVSFTVHWIVVYGL
jgi:hypothetical protein